MEHKVEYAERLKEDLDMSQVEVTTLKQLMHGKNSLVMQKSQALDVAKVFMEIIMMIFFL